LETWLKYLPNKHKAQSSNPSASKKKKIRKEGKGREGGKKKKGRKE
jgi:hypothetical protein